MALHCFVCLEASYIYAGNYISYDYYGSDDVVWIVAHAGNQILDAVLVTGAFVFVLVFFACLYITIKTFTEKIAKKTTEINIEKAATKVAEKSINEEIAEIERFNYLKERGLISEEEFEIKRKKILGI